MESVPDLHVIGAGAGVDGVVGATTTVLPATGVWKVVPIGVPRTGKFGPLPGATPFVGGVPGSTVGVECDVVVLLPGV